jgi:phosphoribosylformylglycinamidine synthase
VGPGADAAVLRLKAPGLPPSARALAVSTDGNHRWCAVDPRTGTAMVVAESALNVACAGARPVALVNCLNFGNPEHPEVMWQLSEAVDGMAEACRALGIPVVGGNVSLYNESQGRDIDPTPIVGTLGIIERLERRPPGPVLVAGGEVWLLGGPGWGAPLGGSRWAAELHGARGGPLPPLDLSAHRALVALVAEVVGAGLVDGAHDVADGGLALALAEMAVAAGVGFVVSGVPSAADLFAEVPSRVVVCVAPDRAGALRERAAGAGVAATFLGRAGGGRLVVEGLMDLALAEAAAAWERAIPAVVEGSFR